MKSRLCMMAVAASSLALFAPTGGASASSVSIDTQCTACTLPSVNIEPTPTLDSGSTFLQSVVGSQTSINLSPNPNNTDTYSVIDPGPGTHPAGFATYDFSGNTSGLFSVIWGSPNSYNTLTFTDAGNNTYVYTDAELLNKSSGGYDFVTFNLNDIVSVSFSDNGEAAFEYEIPDITLAGTPIPGALPLFAGGLVLIGLLTWRRKQTGSAVTA